MYVMKLRYHKRGDIFYVTHENQKRVAEFIRYNLTDSLYPYMVRIPGVGVVGQFLTKKPNCDIIPWDPIKYSTGDYEIITDIGTKVTEEPIVKGDRLVVTDECQLIREYDSITGRLIGGITRLCLIKYENENTDNRS